jgi:membrane-bound serine protease (ClpP class)
LPRFLGLFLLAAMLLGVGLSFSGAHAQGLTGCSGTQPTYYVASMDMTIDPGASNFVSSSLNDAQSQCANHFVLVMNTFGGDGQSMDNIIQGISKYQAAGGTFITLIAPGGAHAFSAGSYIAEASDRIYMVPGTTIGSATPIVYNIPTGEENTTLTKDINGFTAYMQSLTSRFHRNSTATGLMVTKGVSYPADRAAALHVTDGLINATSLDGALSFINVTSPYTLHTPGVSSVAISILSDPNVSGLLFLVGVFAVLADLYHPTIILSVAGVVAIALALVGLGIFGAPTISIFLMLLGAGFIFLELKTHHGVSALIGVIIFAVGFLLIFNTPPPPANPSPGVPPQANFIQIGTATYVMLAAIGGAGVLGSIYLYRVRLEMSRKKPYQDPTRVVGKTGRLEADLPAGGESVANIESEDYSVTSSEAISAGTIVKVKEVKGLKLVVEKAS